MGHSLRYALPLIAMMHLENRYREEDYDRCNFLHGKWIKKREALSTELIPHLKKCRSSRLVLHGSCEVVHMFRHFKLDPTNTYIPRQLDPSSLQTEETSTIRNNYSTGMTRATAEGGR